MTGSWKGRGNQYIEFARVVYCKLPTNGKQLPAFPHKALTGIEPRPQRWEARVLPLCHRGPHLSDEETAEIADDETDSEYFNPLEENIFLEETTPTFASVLGTSSQTQVGNLSDKDPARLITTPKCVQSIPKPTNLWKKIC